MTSAPAAPTTATRALRSLACPSPPTTRACRPNSSDISVKGISRSGVFVIEAPNQRMFVMALALRASGNQIRPAAWWGGARRLGCEHCEHVLAAGDVIFVKPAM